jgi:hypothetical protein
MSKSFNNLKDLFAHVEKQMQSTLKNEVAERVIQEMSETILEETYEQYTPSGKEPYERRGLRGGLADPSNMHVEIVDDNTISIENTTQGNSRYSNYDIEAFKRGMRKRGIIIK